jgi:flagellin-like protein
MNVFGKKERGWRKARKRGVSPIIATILLVAITVVLAAVLYVLISGLTSGGASSVPIGTTFAFGTPQQVGSQPATPSFTNAVQTCSAIGTAGTCYSVGIQSAGSAATTGNINFGLLTSGSGASYTAVSLVNTAGTIVAQYTAAHGWSAASGTLPVSFSSTYTLLVGYGTTIEGSSLEAIGVGSLSGTTSVVLP